MKEDAQLICPVSYEDPSDIWIKLQTILLDRLPLRDVTWKSPISSSYITIDKLPLRCLPSSANLFKDTDHAFRWFLAPYVNFYLLQAETLEAYRNSKPSIKKWVDQYNGAKKSPWLVIYIPAGVHTLAEYNKIYSKLCNDFYGDRTGDRSVILVPPLVVDERLTSFGVKLSNSTQTLSLITASNNSITDLLSKMREGIVVSFQHRSAMYDADIRRLDSYRGTGNFDFRTLFLVKESLALMYQMMQLPDNALSQYEELEATLSYAPDGVLLESDWPMVASESLKPTENTSSAGSTSGHTPIKEGTNEDSTPVKRASIQAKDVFYDACKNGEDVVAYSINLARMKILQKKMSMLELHRYVFARQMYFLIAHLERPVSCAEKAFSFMMQSSKMIAQRLDDRYLQSIREHELLISESMTANQQDGNIIGNDELSAAAEVTANFTKMYNLRSHQAIIWVLSSCVKIVRVCRDLSLRMIRADEKAMNHNDSIMSADSNSEHGGGKQSDLNAIAMRESSKILSEMLQFALAKLHTLIPDICKTRGQSIALVIKHGALSTADAISDQNGEFLTCLEREIASTGYDRDNLSSDSILISIAVKIKSICGYWACSLGHSNDIPPAIDGANSLNLPFNAKVRLQEVALVALMYKAQWEMLQLAERYRFVIAIQMNAVDVFISNFAYARACELLETILNCGLFSIDKFAAPSSGNDDDSVNRSLGFGSASKIALDNSTTKPVCELQGDWLELKFWILRKYLYCCSMCQDVVKYRVVALQLLLPIFAKPVGLRMLCDDSLRRTLLDNVMLVSESLSNKLKSADFNSSEESISTELELPLLQYFSVYVLARCSNSDEKMSTDLNVAKGYQIIQDEIYPVSSFQCIGGIPQHVMTLKVHSTFASELRTSGIVIVYKKFNANTVLNNYRSNPQYGSSHFSVQNTPLSTPYAIKDGRVPNTGKSSLIVEDDEFECIPLDNSSSSFILKPGDNFIPVKFSPPSLGEYSLDRVIISIGESLFFISKILSDELESGFGQVGTVIDTSLQAHDALQKYFDKYYLINVLSPSDLLQLKAITPAFTPINQIDELCLEFSTKTNEKIKELRIIAIHSQHGDVDDIGPEGSIINYAHSSEHLMTPPRKASRSMATTVDGEFDRSSKIGVIIEDASEWNVTLSNVIRETKDNNNDFDVAFSNVNSLTFDRILENSNLQLKIPFYTSYQNNIGGRSSSFSSVLSEGRNDNKDSGNKITTTIAVSVSGNMLRNGCNIAFEIVSNFKIVTGEVLKVELVNMMTSSEEKEEVFLQAILQNVSSVPIHLLGYDFEDACEEIKDDELRNLMTNSLVDGPTDIIQYNSRAITANNSTILVPGDLYYLGFVFSQPLRDLSEGAFCIYFQRHETNLSSDTSTKVFHKTANFPASIYNRHEPKPTILSDFSCCVTTNLPNHVSGYSQLRNSVVSATVGQFSSYRYVLEFDCTTERSPEESSSKKGTSRPYWYYSEIMPDVMSNNNPVSLRRINSAIKSLEVQLASTDNWTSKSSVRVLSSRNLSSEYPNKVLKNSIVTISYELEMALSPRKTGTLSLPPLKVTYSVEVDGEIESEFNLVVPPSSTEGVQSVISSLSTDLTVQ